MVVQARTEPVVAASILDSLDRPFCRLPDFGAVTQADIPDHQVQVLGCHTLGSVTGGNAYQGFKDFALDATWVLQEVQCV